MKYLGNAYHEHMEQLNRESRNNGLRDRESWEYRVIVMGAMLLAGLVLVGVWMAGKLG